MWKEKFIQYLRYEKSYSSQTEISYLKDVTQFEEFLIEEEGSFNPLKTQQHHVRAWMGALMEQGLKARTVNRKLSAIKSFFHYLKKKGVIHSNPAETVKGPKITKRLPTFANHKQMEAVLDDELSFTDDFRGERDRFLIELLYLTGMRRAELISLKKNDIDLYAGTLLVTGKRNKQRIIPFSNETKEKLQRYLRIRNSEIENKSPFLFVKEDGEPLYPKLVYNIVRTHLDSIPTLTKKSPHVLRHSFATGMLNNGAEINTVKELLGHDSLASTEVYTHVTFEEMKKTYQLAHPRAKKKEE